MSKFEKLIDKNSSNIERSTKMALYGLIDSDDITTINNYTRAFNSGAINGKITIDKLDNYLKNEIVENVNNQVLLDENKKDSNKINEQLENNNDINKVNKHGVKNDLSQFIFTDKNIDDTIDTNFNIVVSKHHNVVGEKPKGIKNYFFYEGFCYYTIKKMNITSCSHILTYNEKKLMTLIMKKKRAL